MQLADFLRQFQDSGEIVFDSNEPPKVDSSSEADAIQQLLVAEKGSAEPGACEKIESGRAGI